MQTTPSILILASLIGGLSLAQADSAVMAPRTNAYAQVMVNAAADNSVNDYTKRPTIIGDQQYIVGGGGLFANGANLQNGAFSIKGMGFNWFGMMTANTAYTASGAPLGPDILNFGLANKQWGAGLQLAFAKADSTYPTPAPEKKKTYNMDGLGVFGNFRLSSNSDVYGKLGMTTDYKGVPTTDFYQKTATETSNSVIGILAGWKMDANNQGDQALNVELAINIGNKKNVVPAPDTGKLLTAMVTVSHGVILKQAAGFGVFAGSNNTLMYRSETRNKVKQSEIFLNLGPNLEFQKTLGKGFEVFSGITGNLMYDHQDLSSTVGTNWNLWTTGADAAVGLRWNYENVALEGKVADALLFNGPDMVGGKAPGLFTEAGVAVGF